MIYAQFSGEVNIFCRNLTPRVTFITCKKPKDTVCIIHRLDICNSHNESKRMPQSVRCAERRAWSKRPWRSAQWWGWPQSGWHTRARDRRLRGTWAVIQWYHELSEINFPRLKIPVLTAATHLGLPWTAQSADFGKFHLNSLNLAPFLLLNPVQPTQGKFFWPSLSGDV